VLTFHDYTFPATNGFQVWRGDAASSGPRATWTSIGNPFAGQADMWSINFNHAPALEQTPGPGSMPDFALHLVAPNESIDRLGGTDLRYDVYETRTGRWRYASAGTTNIIFTIQQFADPLGPAPAGDWRFFENGDLTVSADGRLVAAFQARRVGRPAPGPDRYADSSVYLTERRLCGWLVGSGTGPWRFSIRQVLGDPSGEGLGAYRPFFPKPDRQSSTLAHLLYPKAEHFNFPDVNVCYGDTLNPYAFNAFTTDAGVGRAQARFAGFFYQRIVLDPGRITAALDDDSILTLDWDGAGTLMQADEITGPWQAVPDALPPFPVNLGDPAKSRRRFFYLK
jgi:hypothetical protein